MWPVAFFRFLGATVSISLASDSLSFFLSRFFALPFLIPIIIGTIFHSNYIYVLIPECALFSLLVQCESLIPAKHVQDKDLNQDARMRASVTGERG